MIGVRPPALSSKALLALRRYQAAIDRKPTYPEQVAAAKRLFSQQNRPNNRAFTEVKRALAAASAEVQRCHYCEDSMADEVEHILPKDFYPERTFDWENYLYACGPCNLRKSNHCGVLDPARPQPVIRKLRHRADAPLWPPRPGLPALLNPRAEEPQQLPELDLRDTFRFQVRDDLDPTGYDPPYRGTPLEPLLARALRLRAWYTIRVLQLNRDPLPQARRNAHEAYLDRLELYIRRRDDGQPTERLALIIRAIRRMPHPTVWREMQRQQEHHPELAALFAQAPEALTW